MLRLAVLVIAAAIIFSLAAAIRFRGSNEAKAPPPGKLIFTSEYLHLMDKDLEDKLIFYLVQKLGIYEGEFEIIDAVNLDTHGAVGSDYILITLKAPDGRLCQVTLSRQAFPGAGWEVDLKNIIVVEMPESGPGLSIYTKNAPWLNELGVAAQEVSQYYLAHPGMTKEEIGFIFLDKETGRHALPSDWWQSIARESPFRLEINKDKGLRFVSRMGQENTFDSYWKIDYPAHYSGPGYREYLYKKAGGEKR